MRTFYRTGLKMVSEDFEGNRSTFFEGEFAELNDAVEFYRKTKKIYMDRYSENVTCEVWALEYDAESLELVWQSCLDIA